MVTVYANWKYVMMGQQPTWAGFKGPHAVSKALFVAGAETDSVTERSSDVSMTKRHNLQHLFDPRLQVSQQLLQCPANIHLGANAQQSCTSLSNIHIHILRGMGGRWRLVIASF